MSGIDAAIIGFAHFVGSVMHADSGCPCELGLTYLEIGLCVMWVVGSQEIVKFTEGRPTKQNVDPVQMTSFVKFFKTMREVVGAEDLQGSLTPAGLSDALTLYFAVTQGCISNAEGCDGRPEHGIFITTPTTYLTAFAAENKRAVPSQRLEDMRTIIRKQLQEALFEDPTFLPAQTIEYLKLQPIPTTTMGRPALDDTRLDGMRCFD